MPRPASPDQHTAQPRFPSPRFPSPGVRDTGFRDFGFRDFGFRQTSFRTEQMRPRILIDGFNLALEHGTGVSTYARNLSYRLGTAGAEVEAVRDHDKWPRELYWSL